MISVAYDVTSLAQSPFGGIAQVCQHTLEQAAKEDRVEPTALYRRGDPWHLQVPGVRVTKVKWLDRFLGRRYDIVHALGHRIPPVRHHRLVYTLYDAWSLYPNEYQSSEFQKVIGRRMRRELIRADAIVCISEATRRKLLELDIVDSAKCRVALMGVSSPPSPVSPPPKLAAELATPFVLFVGRIEVRKNLEHIVAAVSPIDNLDLVIVGEPGYGYTDIERKALASFPANRLHRFAKISDTDLDWLYRNALATMQPSWEEGFGLPILEAMVRGCPVISSDCSASGEVAGEGGILVDPSQPMQSEEALRKMVADPDYRNEVAAAGPERCSQFNWTTYFGRLTEIYRELARR